MSKIEWTEATPNPVVGCTKKSAGCENCYAIRMAWRLMHSPNENVRKKYKGTVRKTEGGKLNWTGKINYDPGTMYRVIANKKPTVHFVNSMGDLFHPNVSFDQIDLVFAGMAAAPWHTFQILTKHPERMREWFNYSDPVWANLVMQGGDRIRYYAFSQYGAEIPASDWQWPLKNVWLGTSVENQAAAIERIPILMKVPAAIRFISAEPLLGPVDITNMGIKDGYSVATRSIATEAGLLTTEWIYPGPSFIGLDWVIVGGESGPHSRAMHPDWVRSLRDQCTIVKVPFMFKQWGEYYTTWLHLVTLEPIHKMYSDYVQFTQKLWVHKGDQCIDLDGKNCRTAGDMQTARYPVAIMNKVGKKKAGRMLDGVLHDERPLLHNERKTVNHE